MSFSEKSETIELIKHTGFKLNKLLHHNIFSIKKSFSSVPLRWLGCSVFELILKDYKEWWSLPFYEASSMELITVKVYDVMCKYKCANFDACVMIFRCVLLMCYFSWNLKNRNGKWSMVTWTVLSSFEGCMLSDVVLGLWRITNCQGRSYDAWSSTTTTASTKVWKRRFQCFEQYGISSFIYLCETAQLSVNVLADLYIYVTDLSSKLSQ